MNRQEQVEALLRAFSRRDLAAIRDLADAEVDLDQPGGAGLTPLMRSILRGQMATVEWMLAAGADPNAHGTDGTSPLALARQLDDPEIVALLEAAGACEPEPAILVTPSTPAASEPKADAGEGPEPTLAPTPTRAAPTRSSRQSGAAFTDTFDDQRVDDGFFGDRFEDDIDELPA